jgi:hypothetical protein
MTTTYKNISVIILLVIIVLIIIYGIVLFETYKNQTFIFSQYTPPPPPTSQNAFYPLGNVTQLTQEEIEQRNAIINASARGT